MRFRKPHKSSQVPGRRGQGVRRRVPRLDGEDERGRATGPVRQRWRVPRGRRTGDGQRQRAAAVRAVAGAAGRGDRYPVRPGRAAAGRPPAAAVREPATDAAAVRAASALFAAAAVVVRAAAAVVFVSAFAAVVRAARPVLRARQHVPARHPRTAVDRPATAVARLCAAAVPGAAARPVPVGPLAVRTVRRAHAAQAVRGQTERHRGRLNTTRTGPSTTTPALQFCWKKNLML